MPNTPRKPNQKQPQTAEERRAAAEARRAAAARQGTSVGTGSARGGGATASGGGRSGGDRNRYLLYGGIGVVVLVIAIVAAVQAFSGSGKKDVSKISTVASGSTVSSGSTGSSSSDSDAVVGGIATVDGLLGTIPQSGNTLGKANAPVTVIDYVDLLCPVCADYSQNGFNDIVNDYVAKGQVKVQFEYYPVIYLNNQNPSDEVAVGAFEAAKKQNKLFTMALLWYRNQGDEADNYATDQYVDAIAQAAGIDLASFGTARKAVNGKSYIDTAAAAGQKLGVSGTPTSIVVDKNGKRSSPLATAAVPAAIAAALKS